MNVGVFCSCTENVSPLILAEAEAVGEMLASQGYGVVYGGCSAGSMGALARGVLSRRGRLIGVIPKMDFVDGKVHQGLSERHVVPSLSARKESMIALSDAFVVLPGGLGTLDEALEVLALKSIGGLKKPIVFYNYLNLWTPFLDSMELLVQSRMIRQALDQLLVVLDKPESLRDHLESKGICA